VIQFHVKAVSILNFLQKLSKFFFKIPFKFKAQNRVATLVFAFCIKIKLEIFRSFVIKKQHPEAENIL